VGRLVTGDRVHWETTYAERTPEKLSWYEPLPQRSLDLIQAANLGSHAGIIDVGGGASSLAAQLLGMGYTDLTVADISPAALSQGRAELGNDAARVSWIEADIRRYDFGRQYDLWHDRAVFHFMVSPEDRAGYLDVMARTCDREAISSSRPSVRRDRPNAVACPLSATALRSFSASSAGTLSSLHRAWPSIARLPGQASSSSAHTCIGVRQPSAVVATRLPPRASGEGWASAAAP
jgi:ubiquinone/menaquinone biosynthesis C-methylase UbiE